MKRSFRKVWLLSLWFKTDRFPWHTKMTTSAFGSLDPNAKKVGEKWGWRSSKIGGMGRFGGGWTWKLGIAFGGSCMIIDVIIGSILLTWRDPS